MVMDRSNWKIGKTNINVLFVGLLLPNGIFIPIIWKNLDKKGNSKTSERIDLMERFCKVWNQRSEIKVILLADREFIGVEWFSYIRQLNWSFVIRLRHQDYLSFVAAASGRTTFKTACLMDRKLLKNGFFQSKFDLAGQQYYYTVFPNTAQRKTKSSGDKYLILLSNFNDLELISQSYKARWGIEVFFYHCKSNGFNLEDLNLKQNLKNQLIMGVTSLAYALSIRNGLHCQRTKKTKIYFKSYQNKKTKSRDVSLFRLGYDNLKSSVHSLKDLMKLILSFIRSRLSELPDVNLYFLKYV